MNIKAIKKQIVKLDFFNAYNELKKNSYIFNFDNLTRDFPDLDSLQAYIFLMYAISLDEDVDKHLSICYYLSLINPYILGADSLIKWHLLQALKISPYDERVLKNWVFGIYNGNPDCPFSKEEIEDFSEHLKEH